MVLSGPSWDTNQQVQSSFPVFAGRREGKGALYSRAAEIPMAAKVTVVLKRMFDISNSLRESDGLSIEAYCSDV